MIAILCDYYLKIGLRAHPGSSDLISVIKCGRIKWKSSLKMHAAIPAIRANHVDSCISGVYTLCACTFIADYRMLGRAPLIKCISKRSWVALKTLQRVSSNSSTLFKTANISILCAALINWCLPQAACSLQRICACTHKLAVVLFNLRASILHRRMMMLFISSKLHLHD